MNIKYLLTKVSKLSTCSSAMVVRPVCPTNAGKGGMALKLFDRRFATKLRQNAKMSSSTSDIEQHDRHSFSMVMYYVLLPS